MTDSTAEKASLKGNGRFAGLILAAGKASRMGRLKQLLPYQGKPILSHTLDHAATSGVSPLILVLGCGQDRILRALPEPPADVILNSAWEWGMASSIAAGIGHLERISPG
ncbi:MAG: NTP transferase domain-containing protein, partial [Desulfobacterales bacterium]|nr:NTP transferase domain-containing protein [Desulfobacterales bacterium]